MSRHLAEPTSANVIVHFAQDVIELAISNVAFHLLVPIVIFPSMKPRCEFSTLLERKLFDCTLNFLYAHVFTLTDRFLRLQLFEVADRTVVCVRSTTQQEQSDNCEGDSGDALP